MADVWHINCDETETITGLSAGGSYLNNVSTISYAITDDKGTAVAGGTGSYSYVAASNGNYTAEIDASITATLDEGKKYYLDVTTISGSYKDYRKLERRVEYRGAS